MSNISHRKEFDYILSGRTIGKNIRYHRGLAISANHNIAIIKPKTLRTHSHKTPGKLWSLYVRLMFCSKWNKTCGSICVRFTIRILRSLPPPRQQW